MLATTLPATHSSPTCHNVCGYLLYATSPSFVCLTACTFHHTCVAINKHNIYLYIFKHPVEVTPDGECVKIVMYRNSVNYTHISLALMLKSIRAPTDAPPWCCTLILHQTNLQNDAVK
jgi:hypothetical protein